MKFILPDGIKSLSDEFSGDEDWWAQDIVDQSEHLVVQKLKDLLGLSAKKVDIIHHNIRCDVSEHADGISKTCYIIPVSITGEWVFYCDGRKDRKVKVGDAIRFNDFNRHGMNMIKEGTIKIFTVSTVPF